MDSDSACLAIRCADSLIWHSRSLFMYAAFSFSSSARSSSDCSQMRCTFFASRTACVLRRASSAASRSSCSRNTASRCCAIDADISCCVAYMFCCAAFCSFVIRVWTTRPSERKFSPSIRSVWIVFSSSSVKLSLILCVASFASYRRTCAIAAHERKVAASDARAQGTGQAKQRTS